jgi:predicted metal-binding protein
MITAEDLKQIALDLDIPHTALLDTSDIQFHDDFRKACEKNVCGKYNATWMGPPVIGPIRELKKKVLCFRQGLLLQTVHQVAGSLDMKGMLAAAEEHRAVFRSFLEKIRNKFPFNIRTENSFCQRYLDIFQVLLIDYSFIFLAY